VTKGACDILCILPMILDIDSSLALIHDMMNAINVKIQQFTFYI